MNSADDMPTLKRLVYLKYLWLNEQLTHEIERLGGSPRTQAQATVLMVLNGGSLSISEIARQLGISRQAAHKTVNELVVDGWLYLETAKQRNTKQVEFTEYGIAQRAIVREAMMLVEARVVNAVGDDGLQLMKTLLAKQW